MTSLIGEELFEYLGHLQSEIDKRISATEKGSFQYLMHSQMGEIINSEINFLKYTNSMGTQAFLAISSNGMPRVDSLKSDLETMSKLAETENNFRGIPEKLKNGEKEINRGEVSYSLVSQEEWQKQLSERSGEKLQSKYGFKINETPEGKFEFSLREEIFLQGYDKYSKEFPVLMREGQMRYHAQWNRLITGCEEIFYAPENALVLNGKQTEINKKIFDNINIFYSFRKKDYKSFNGKMPWMFWDSWMPNNYEQFLYAGTNSRVAITNSILDTLGKTLGKQIVLGGIRKNDLERIMAFSSIPFENAPQTTLTEEDLYELDPDGRIKGNKYPTKFNLICKNGAEKIGTVEYFLPRKEIRISSGNYGGKFRDYKFTLGGIELNVFGSAISDEIQFQKLQKVLIYR